MENERDILMSYHDIVSKSGTDLPEKGVASGIYFLVQDSVIVYVGCSTCIRGRILVHKRSKEFNAWFYIPYKSMELAKVDEADFIWDMIPKYNRRDNGAWELRTAM